MIAPTRIKAKIAWLPKTVWFGDNPPKKVSTTGKWKTIWLQRYYTIQKRQFLGKWVFYTGNYGRRCDAQNVYDNLR